jgi:hypothetical protein
VMRSLRGINAFLEGVNSLFHGTGLVTTSMGCCEVRLPLLLCLLHVSTCPSNFCRVMKQHVIFAKCSCSDLDFPAFGTMSLDKFLTIINYLVSGTLL